MSKSSKRSDSYARAGVDQAQEERNMAGLVEWATRSFGFRSTIGTVKLPLGFFANVIDLGNGKGLAISTDGVGSKVLVAQAMHRYDTVGIDCVASNVNDVLAVGAEPLAFVDYIALQEPRRDLLDGIAKGLYEGAKQARIAIVGGEISQLKAIIKGERPGYGFDLAGTCVGSVLLEKLFIGEHVQEGNVVVGLRSSGLHTNGISLARRILLQQKGLSVNDYSADLGRVIGDELLEPTRIYVPEILDMLSSISVKALIHISGRGLTNLARVKAEMGFIIDSLPEPQPVFGILQKLGKLPDAEMFSVFNMGIGFCVVVPGEEAKNAITIAANSGCEAFRIGYAVPDSSRKVRIIGHGLVSEGSRFVEG